QLLNSRRIQPAFHVTLIHRGSSKDEPKLWSHYLNLYTTTLQQQLDTTGHFTDHTPKLGPARVRIERLVWDARIMAFVVRILPREATTTQQSGGAAAGDADATGPWPCANEI